MPQLNRNFTAGRMNKDADERLLPPGEYRHAENINIVNSETSENAGAVKNLFSNKKLTNFSFTGTVYNITPKPLVYEAKNKIYWLCKDDVGCYLFEYNINSQHLIPVLIDTRPLATRVLNLDENFLVTGIDILKTENEDKELLLWTDNNMQPCCVNINRAKTWDPNDFEEEDILLIKKPPLYAPKITLTYVNDNSNNLEEKFLSFCYRYKYLDGEYSALSSYSNYNFNPKKFELDFFTMVNKGMVNKFNAVKIEFNTGDKRVIEIQLVVKESLSNTLYIVETFNKKKEGIFDNVQKTFIFSNQKIFTALPENELFRLFDNVPLKAKAQTLINNFISYGNYLEFFNIIDENKKDIVIDYDVSLSSTNTEITNDLSVSFPYTLFFGTIRISKRIAFQNSIGITYQKDYVLSFSFSINIYNVLAYENEFYFILPDDYATLEELVDSIEFINFVEVIKNHFASNYNANNEYDIDPDYVISTHPNIYFSVTAGIPTFLVNPIIFRNPSDNNALIPVDLSFNLNSTVSITSIINTTSCKSNKNYQVGIEYIYKYNRATTALTSKNNTLFIPQYFSTFKNQLRVTLNSLPPIDAERYKFVVKTNPLQYQTIYVNEFYNEDNYVWAKLQADNKDKVNIGDTLNLKLYGNIPATQPSKIKVLDIKTFEKDFLVDNEDQEGNPILETAGVYMKIRPDGFSMDLDDYTIKQFKSKEGASDDNMRFPFSMLSLFTEIDPITSIVTELPIEQGSSIYIMINSSFKLRSGWVNIRFEKTFYAQRDYTTLEQWFNENFLNGNYIPGIDLRNGESTDYAPNLSLVRGNLLSTGGVDLTPTGKLYLKSIGLISGSSGQSNRYGYTRSEIVIRKSTGIYVFETEPIQADTDIFFESEETFDIVNGEHHGSAQFPIVQNQDNDPLVLAPAIIDLNFFNCYTQGNGVESYRVRDEFNTNALNIDLRPTTVSVEPYKQIRRFADITHSSLPYNESSNINGLNNFNLSTANFKELDKQYGSVQLIFNKENDVLIVQEEKAGLILFGKEAIYTAEGEPIITNISEVLGRYKPYQGNNGIGLNPESFAQDNFRFYWFNPNFGVPIRLSIDGTTEINKGMETHFRNLAITHRNAIKIGSFDTFHKLYTLSIGEEPIQLDYFNCGNIFEKEITESYTYILNLNNQLGDITLNYQITGGSVNITTLFNGVTENHEDLTGTNTVTIDRNTLEENQVIITITPIIVIAPIGNESEPGIYVKITNVCPIPIPLNIVLVVIGDVLEAGKTILNRFRTNLNTFFQYEDTFSVGPVTKFQTISGFEGQRLFPINGDTITIQSVKTQSHTGSFLQSEEANQLKYLISNGAYSESNINDLLTDSTALVLTQTIQGIDQNTFSGQFEFNRATQNQKLYLIWDFTSKNAMLQDDFAFVAIGQSVIIDVLANDLANANCVVAIQTDGLYGTSVVNVDKTITYTHDGTAPGELNVDTVTYSVTQNGLTAYATIEITIYTAEALPTLHYFRSGVSSLESYTCGSFAPVREVYVDVVPFSSENWFHDVTEICKDAAGTIPGDIGWYVNNNVYLFGAAGWVLFWDGSAVTSTTFCEAT
jgi:hypothetical protein